MGSHLPPVPLPGHTAAVRAVCFSKDGQWALSGGDDHQVILWDVAMAKSANAHGTHKSGVRGVMFPQMGLGHSVDTRRKAFDWTLPGGPVANAAVRFSRVYFGSGTSTLSPDGRYKFSTNGSDLVLKRPGKRTAAKTFRGEGSGVIAIAFSPDSKFAITGGLDRKVRIWDIENRRFVLELAGHEGPVTAVAISPDNQRALSGGQRELLKWELEGAIEGNMP